MQAAAHHGGLTAMSVVERAIQRLLAEPAVYSYGSLAFGGALALLHHRDSAATMLEILAWLAVASTWLPFWIRRRTEDPGGRTLTTILLGLMGSLLMGRLIAFDLAFAILALYQMAQYFTLLPFPLALLYGIPQSIGAEYSHRLAVLADPGGYPWGVAIVRGLALAAIGVSFKVLALQMEERARLEASLAAAERKAGILEERQRLTREIHDTLAQGFAGIVVHLETAEQIDPLRGSGAKPHLDLARSVAREGLEEARRMLRAMRPELLEQRALPEALDRVCDDWSRRSGLMANFSVTGTAAPMHPDIELTILRAVQEALTNIARHSGARTAAVTLSYMEDVLVLDVQDDGRGFTPAAGRGFGLAGMRERVESLQGTCSVESVPGEGTTISIELPVLGTAAVDALTRGRSA